MSAPTSAAIASRSHGARTPVAVLGATGAVGQAFVRLLAGHPWFELCEVAASERSAGHAYADATHWLGGVLPPGIADLVVQRCDPAAIRAPLVFSALDAGVAGEVEIAFARAGRVVCSNAHNHRMRPDVPLLIPEINAAHVRVLRAQRERAGWDGAIVTNANCSSTIAALALAPLHEAFGVRRVFAATLQAVSGAGYPGVPSLDILGNVIPHIGGEEAKLEEEIAKLLGTVSADSSVIEPAPLTVTAHTNRVAVEEGHTVCLSVGLDRRCTPADALEVLASWTGAPEAHGLPSCPLEPLVMAAEPDRPQPRRDVRAGGGMAVTVGRVRDDRLLDLRLVAMGSNMVRGAAGGALINAELLASHGVVQRP